MGQLLRMVADNAMSFFMSLVSFTGLFYGAVEVTSLSLVDTVYPAKFIGVFKKTRRPRTLFARR